MTVRNIRLFTPEEYDKFRETILRTFNEYKITPELVFNDSGKFYAYLKESLDSNIANDITYSLFEHGIVMITPQEKTVAFAIYE